MSLLWFEIVNLLDDDPDWSELDDGRIEKAYRKIEKPSRKPFVEKYNWLKPPEDWNKPEAIDGI